MFLFKIDYCDYLVYYNACEYMNLVYETKIGDLIWVDEL